MTTKMAEMQAVEMLNGFFNEYESKSGVAHVDKGFTALVGMHYGNGYKVVAIERCYNTVDEAIEAVRYFADKADNEFKHNNYGRVDSGVGRNRKEYFKLGYKGYQLLTAEYFNAIIDEYAVSEAAQEVAIAAEEANAASNMTDIEKVIAERKTMTVRELFLEAKKEVGYERNARGAKMWFICYPRYDINTEEYVGHTMPLKRTSKDVEIYLREEYCGMTLKTFLAEEKAWIDEETDKVIRQLNIDDEAFHLRDKIICESYACDDNDDVFSLLPDVSELNDVDNEPEPPTVDDFDSKLAKLTTQRDEAQAALLKAQETHETAEQKLQDFLKSTAADLAGKLQSLNGNLDYSIKLVTASGYSFTVTDFDNIYVNAFNDGKEFAFVNWRSKKYARYDTPAQVEQVIDLLREAIARGVTDFTFPTIDELEPPTDYVGRKLVQDNSCSKITQFYIGDAKKEELITFDAGRWVSIKSNYYGAEIYNGTDNKIHFRVGKFFDDASGEWVSGPGKDITNADEFFQIMVKRGACTIDETPTVEEIFAVLPADSNADNYRMARYITYAHSDGTNYAIRSTDFARAEKALALLKAALTKQIGEYKFGIDFYPIEFDAKKIVTVYHAEELDGSEEDEETFTPDVMPVEDGDDDDELIDPPEKDLSTLKYFDNVRLIRSKWGEVWEVYELRDVRKYRSRGSKHVELCQRGRNERWWTISPKELTLRLDEYGLTIADLKPYVESRGRVIA